MLLGTGSGLDNLQIKCARMKMLITRTMLMITVRMMIIMINQNLNQIQESRRKHL